MEEFEKHYNGLAVEAQMQKYWEDNKVYARRIRRPRYIRSTPRRRR